MDRDNAEPQSTDAATSSTAGPSLRHNDRNGDQDFQAGYTASPAWQQTLSTQVILPDGTWPYLIWNHSMNKLEVNPKQRGLSMTTFIDHLTAIREHLCRPMTILRMQALRPPVSSGTIHSLEDADWTQGDRALRSALQASSLQCMATASQRQKVQQCQPASGQPQVHNEGQTLMKSGWQILHAGVTGMPHSPAFSG